jgi:EAL domain-containing protein (putative c-di-GMP-specific phosphodiesterase class I)
MKRHSMMDELCQPGAIRMEFQPIVKLGADGAARLYMVEALARGPADSSFARPDVMFEYARRKNEEAALDMICVAEALSSASILPAGTHLSINIHGSTIGTVPRFVSRLIDGAAAFGIAADRLMLEIVEHRGPWPASSFHKALHELREAGVRLALDDLGAGASNYHLFITCRPDHIKIDRTLVQGSSADVYRRAVLESIVTLSRACGATAIAEGIESLDDLATVRCFGIDCGQGWLFARSMPAAELARFPLTHNYSTTSLPPATASPA